MNACCSFSCCSITRFGMLAAAIAASVAIGMAATSTPSGKIVDETAVKTDDKAAAKSTVKGDPYPLNVCPISGKTLGGMGEAVVKDYDGREVRFCCGGCVSKFEEDKVAAFKKIDEKIIASQLPHYPLKNCVVMPDDELVNEGDGKAVDLVYNNRLVRFCCAGCIKKFKADPATYLAKIDAAVIAEQKPQYPLDTDVVTGEKLGANAIDKVYGVMLVRFANADSIAKYNADPYPSMLKIHEAWMAKHPHGDAKDAPKAGSHG